MTSACALFRASNVLTLDYPYAEAIASALAFCDEAVIVVGPSFDATRDAMYAVQTEHGADRVKVIERQWQFDRTWQERVWAWGAEQTTADWLACVDLDDIVHEADAATIRECMGYPRISLLTFPMVHLYGTPRWRECKKFYPTHTRIGRRAVNFRMMNLCDGGDVVRPVCALVADRDGQAIESNAWLGAERLKLSTPLYHYGWVRDARALAISQAKHFAWYADGAGLEDGHIPDVEPYPFNMPACLAAGRLTPYAGPYPAIMAAWSVRHEAAWAALDATVTAQEVA